jgi:hypothetical protein
MKVLGVGARSSGQQDQRNFDTQTPSLQLLRKWRPTAGDTKLKKATMDTTRPCLVSGMEPAADSEIDGGEL